MNDCKKLRKALALIDEVLGFHWNNKKINQQFLALLDSSAFDLDEAIKYLEEYEVSDE